LTDGFGLASITADYPFHNVWDVKHRKEDVTEALAALSQRYTYLASGSQSYVFESDDGKYVIKFFKHKRWRNRPFYLQLLPFGKKNQQYWIRKKWETVNDTFTSCKISYDRFREETALLYVHLNPTDTLHQTLIVKDRVGIKHKLSLDSLQFILQKKAVPTDRYLLSLKEKNDIETAKRAILEILSFTKRRAKEGYSDKDPHSIRNFGFIDGKMVEIDIGGFHRDPRKNYTYYQTKEIFRIRDKMLPWVNDHFPEMTPFVQEQINLIALENRDAL